MSIFFKNAPLLEIVAELRWPIRSPFGFFIRPDSGPIIQPAPPADPEEFYSRFGSEIARIGFARSERLIPLNFSAPPGSVVMRFKETPTEDRSSSNNMFQIGSGIFSANALPPYLSWNDFAPVVEKGVTALLKSRSEDERNMQFPGLSLRYINAFKDSLIGSMGAHQFATEILGFQFELPNGISKHVQAGKQVNPNLSFSFPLDDTSIFTMTVAEGAIQNERALIMDMTVSQANVPVNASASEIMACFLRFREVMHDVFTTTTVKLHGKMEAS